MGHSASRRPCGTTALQSSRIFPSKVRTVSMIPNPGYLSMASQRVFALLRLPCSSLPQIRNRSTCVSAVEHHASPWRGMNSCSLARCCLLHVRFDLSHEIRTFLDANICYIGQICEERLNPPARFQMNLLDMHQRFPRSEAKVIDARPNILSCRCAMAGMPCKIPPPRTLASLPVS